MVVLFDNKLYKQFMALNPKQQAFVEHYLANGRNAVKAAQSAGYKNYNSGPNLLMNASIKAEIDAKAKILTTKLDIKSEDILRELSKLANSDIRQIWDERGALLPTDQWPDDIAFCVQSVEVDELYEGTGKDRIMVGYTKKVKFWDKVKALEMLGKYKKMFTEKVEHTTPPGEAVAVVPLTAEEAARWYQAKMRECPVQ